MLAKIKPNVVPFTQHADKIVTIFPVGLVEMDDGPPYMGYQTDPPTKFNEGYDIVWGIEDFILLEGDVDTDVSQAVEALNNLGLTKSVETSGEQT